MSLALPSPPHGSAVDEDYLAALARWLEALADLSGDARLRRAAGIVRGKRLGRFEIDDAASLAEMELHLSADPTISIERAAALVARTKPRHCALESATRRLARKFREEKLKSVAPAVTLPYVAR